MNLVGRSLVGFLSLMLFGLSLLSCDGDNDKGVTPTTIPAAPSTSIALHSADDPGSSFIIILTTVSGATGYRLYESDDGTTYSEVIGTNIETMGSFGYALQTSATDKYFHVRAYNTAGESEPGPVIFAEPDNYSSSGNFITAPADGATGVSLTPLIELSAVTGASKYALSVYTTGEGGSDIWNVLLSDGKTSVSYGDTQPNVETFVNSTSLANNSLYGVTVEAVNANNWGYLKDDNTFTTAGGGGL